MEDYELERATYEVDTKRKKKISDVKDGYSDAIKKANVGRNKGDKFSMKSGLDTVYRALLEHEDHEIERIKSERIQKIFGDQKEEKPPENEVANQEPEPKPEPQSAETSENTGQPGIQQKALGKGKDIERGLSTEEINNYMRK